MESIYCGGAADLHEQLTMRAVLLHVLGDTISSCNVIVCALLIQFLDDDSSWKYRIDPVARQRDICQFLPHDAMR